jgi:uncharacterized membrane protein YczE
MKKVLFFIVGITIACLGVTFILKSQAGAGPQDVVLLVLAEKTGLTFGTWVIISQGVFLLAHSILLKIRPRIESILTMIIWGAIVDFWLEIVFSNLDIWLNTPLLRWVCFLFGVVLIGLGVGTYITANLPTMPYDGLMVGLTEKYKVNLMVSRTLLEIICILIGIAVGGKIGVGTIVLVLCIGTVIQFFNGIALKLYHFSFRF